MSLILFISFMDRIYRHSQGTEGILFGGNGISALLCSDLVLLVPLSEDLQLSLEPFIPGGEVEKMRIRDLQNRRLLCSLISVLKTLSGYGMKYWY